MDNSLSDTFSPFETGFGRFADGIEIGLNDMGFMKIWRCGELQVWGPDADTLDKPSITFTPEHADLLEMLAAELRARATEYAEYQSRVQGLEETQRLEEEALERGEEEVQEGQSSATHRKKGGASTSPDQPQLINMVENNKRAGAKVATAGSP